MRKFAALLCSVMLLFTGIKKMTEAEGINMTENQVRIVESSTLDPERVKKGVLMPHEEVLLRCVEEAERYLAARYPEERFVFKHTTGNMGMPSSTGYRFLVDAEKANIEVEVRTTVAEDDSVSCSDDYCAYRYQSELNEYIEKLLGDAGYADARSAMLLGGVYGTEIDVQKSLVQLIGEDNEFFVTGSVYFPDDTSLNKEDMQAALSGHGLYGTTAVYTLLTMPEGEARNNWGREYPQWVTKRVFFKIESQQNGGAH